MDRPELRGWIEDALARVDQPTLTLPDEQDQLIEAVATANPRTVVVLNSGYPVLMPWVNDVRSILDMWYPGQEGGLATADLLTGAAVPGGKLPVTVPARESDARPPPHHCATRA